MGNFSRDTFDQLKHYVGVRLQQGVPLVDADWNEQEDIRKHELRTFLKWFVGNGVPKGNDGFRIIPLEAGNNDFTIKGGDGTAEGAGRCLVEGWDVMIEGDIRYKEQKLFLNEDDEANKWGVEPLAQLSPPSSGERTDTVYLDVWEREVDAQDDSDMVNPAIGIETCVRIKREWVVRVAQGLAQQDGLHQYLGDNNIFPPGHVYYPIARLNRKAGINTIAGQDIRDLRQTGLSLQHNIRGTISSSSNIENVTTNHTRQVNASSNSAATHWNSQVNASIAVATADHNTVCGGYGEGEPSRANRKWELNSKAGTLTLKNTVINSFSDYGEYFENLKKGEIDIGLLIVLEGAKVRPAKKDEDFIGVVSGTAAIRLGDSPFCWQGRYMKDEWGRPVYEEIKDPAWQPKTIPDEKWKPKDGETEADRPMIAVETEKDRPSIRVQKENPDYDPKREQEPRSERPKEWTLIGLLGQVYVRCNETVQPGDFVKSKNKGIGTKSEDKTKLRAMKVTKPFDGKYSIVYCLLK
jgi:hypothetical protein